jgi:hypothetical protein
MKHNLWNGIVFMSIWYHVNFDTNYIIIFQKFEKFEKHFFLKNKFLWWKIENIFG